MKRPHFRIAGLLGVVLFVAVALAALRESTELWDSGVFSVTLAVLLVSIVLAVYRRDRKRAFWIGFALFGGAYLVASLVPPVESRLLTTKGLAYLGALRPSANFGVEGIAVLDYDSDGQADLFVSKNGSPGALYVNSGNGTFQDVTLSLRASTRASAASNRTWGRFLATPRGSPEHFVRIGHSLFVLVLAIVGGCLSRLVGRAARAETRGGDPA